MKQAGFALGILCLIGCSKPIQYDIKSTYYPSGRLKEEGLVSNYGRMEGKSIRYFEDGKVKALNYYDANMPVGAQVKFRSNGTVEKIDYRSGVDKSGPRLHFDSAGRLSSMSTYRDGKMHGPHYAFHANGNVMYKGEFRNGYPFGPREIFDSSGVPFHGWFEGFQASRGFAYRGKVVQGKPDSLFAYYKDDKVCITAEFKNGLLHGTHKFFDKAGRNDSDWVFEEGRHVKTVRLKKQASVGK